MDPTEEPLTPYLLRLSDVVPRRVDWISPGRLAFGKTSILDGDPGLGKSTVALQWAADMSRGRPILGGPTLKPRHVIILSAEDTAEDTIQPRMEAADADLTRCHVFRLKDVRNDDHLPYFPAYLGHLEQQIDATRAGLVIIDPLMAFLDENIKSNNDQSVRRALSPLASTAERAGCAILLLRHLNKSVGGMPLYRGGGSMGIVGAARFAMVVAKDPEDEAGRTRVIAMQKVNIGKEPPAVAYELETVEDTDVARVIWLGESHHTANTLLSAPTDEVELGKRDEARTWLREALRHGPVTVKELMRTSTETGISWRTFQSAKKELGVISERAGAVWQWRLPDPMTFNQKRSHDPDDPTFWEA
jgi:hypothetical protein